MSEVSTILKVLGEGITIQGSCLTYFFICLIIMYVFLSMEEDSSLAFYTRVCISFLMLESNLKHNLGCQEIFVTGFYLLFHLGIYLQIE